MTQIDSLAFWGQRSVLFLTAFFGEVKVRWQHPFKVKRVGHCYGASMAPGVDTWVLMKPALGGSQNRPAHPAYRAALATSLVSQEVSPLPSGCILMKGVKISEDYLPKWSLH